MDWTKRALQLLAAIIAVTLLMLVQWLGQQLGVINADTPVLTYVIAVLTFIVGGQIVSQIKR